MQKKSYERTVSESSEKVDLSHRRDAGGEESSAHEKREPTPVEREAVNARLVDIYNNPDRVPLTGIIDPVQLKMLSRAGGGFVLRTDREMVREFMGTGRTKKRRMKTLYTNKETRVVYANPMILQGVPELGMKPWTKQELRGGLIHEAGHHAPEVLALDRLLMKDIGNVDIIPEVVRGNAKWEEAFFGALYSQLHNGLLDMWLEAFMSRPGFERNKLSLVDLYHGMGDMKDYRHMPLPEQFVQALLRARFYGDKGMDKKLHPKANEWYRKAIDDGWFKTLLTTKAFESIFQDDRTKEAAIHAKHAAYKAVFLPAWLDLLQQEIEEKKMEVRRWKAEHPGAVFGGPAGLEELIKQFLEYAEKHKGATRGMSVSAGEEGSEGDGGEGQRPSEKDKLPELTPEENEAIVNKVLGVLEEHGGHGGEEEDDDPEKKELWGKLKKFLKDREEKKEGLPPPPSEEPPKPSGMEDLERLARKFRHESEDQEMREKAERANVSPEAVRRWNEIKSSYAFEIESTASSLAEDFLDDRRSRLEFMKREGEIVPGLEFETIGALLSGETDPQTKMREVTNPEFLETEIQFVVDRSGSMGIANRLERAVELIVILVEAFKRVREMLSAEGLVGEEEFPFRLGVSEFSDKPQWITKAEEPLSDTKELSIVNALLTASGGTHAKGAVEGVYKELSTGRPNVIKFMITMTDTDGHYDSVDEPMKAIEADLSVLFYVLAYGETEEAAKATVDKYLAPLTKKEGGHVAGGTAVEPRDGIPKVLEFVKREVAKRRVAL